MTNTIEMIISEVEKFNDSIVNTLNSKNITNTGEAARSLRIEYGNTFVKSIGIFYLEFLDTGRGFGKYPPSAPIRQWVITKLGLTDEDEIEQMTFLVQRKIAQLGTEIFLNNSKGIELEKKVVSLRNSINEQVVETAKADVIQLLNKFKKKYEFKI